MADGHKPLPAAGEGDGSMPKRNRTAKEEERYWRIRAGLEVARLVCEVLWEILRRGGFPVYGKKGLQPRCRDQQAGS